MQEATDGRRFTPEEEAVLENCARIPEREPAGRAPRADERSRCRSGLWRALTFEAGRNGIEIVTAHQNKGERSFSGRR